MSPTAGYAAFTAACAPFTSVAIKVYATRFSSKVFERVDTFSTAFGTAASHGFGHVSRAYAPATLPATVAKVVLKANFAAQGSLGNSAIAFSWSVAVCGISYASAVSLSSPSTGAYAGSHTSDTTTCNGFPAGFIVISYAGSTYGRSFACSHAVTSGPTFGQTVPFET